jgi:hypothetical protein
MDAINTLRTRQIRKNQSIPIWIRVNNSAVSYVLLSASLYCYSWFSATLLFRNVFIPYLEGSFSQRIFLEPNLRMGLPIWLIPYKLWKGIGLSSPSDIHLLPEVQPEPCKSKDYEDSWNIVGIIIIYDISAYQPYLLNLQFYKNLKYFV